MNTFQFAIASIVDANTGNGLIHAGSRQDYGALEKRGRRIRSRSIHDFLQAIKNGIAKSIEAYREQASLRRDLNRLLGFNDHLLEDIGLARNDLLLVKAGLMSMNELHEKRRTRSRQASIEATRSAQIEVFETTLDATNEKFYEQRKCA